MNIHQLIDKYFDGATTVEQESQLRRMLASGEYHGEDVDEACAVMGVFAVKRRMKKKTTLRRLSPTVMRAACAAAVIVCAAFFFLHPSRTNDTFAEINGMQVSQTQALARMHSDLDLFAETYDEMHQQMADDIASMGEIFN